MRLLHTSTLELHEYYGEAIPRYAILSHTWGDEEVSFQQLQRMKLDKSTDLNALEGGRKIKVACELAAAHSYQYIWIDTCCIDKTSSAELSEVINSMYQWYEESHVCFAYLVDVDSAGLNKSSLIRTFGRSRWFTRGWTLQELLVPRSVLFYDKAWVFIGSRWNLSDKISNTTGIQIEHMIRPQEASVAAKMSWASRRTTTRVEDIAYSLVGLFGVNMPLLYGEGMNAFMRLQHEIVKISDDESIFAWQDESVVESGAFARSPKAFHSSGDVINVKYQYLDRPPYTVTHRGLAIELDLEHMNSSCGEHKCLASLRCAMAGTPSNPILIELTDMSQSNYIRSSAYKLKKSTMSYPDRKAHRRELVYINPAETYNLGLGSEEASTFYVKKFSLIAHDFSIRETFMCELSELEPLDGIWTGFKDCWKIKLNVLENLAALLLEDEQSHPKKAFAIILDAYKSLPQMDIVIPASSNTLPKIVENQYSQSRQYSDRIGRTLQNLTIMAELRRRRAGCSINIDISKQRIKARI